MKSAIVKLAAIAEGECGLCGEKKLLEFVDNEMNLKLCVGCAEHAIRAEFELKKANMDSPNATS